MTGHWLAGYLVDSVLQDIADADAGVADERTHTATDPVLEGRKRRQRFRSHLEQWRTRRQSLTALPDDRDGHRTPAADCGLASRTLLDSLVRHCWRYSTALPVPLEGMVGVV